MNIEISTMNNDGCKTGLLKIAFECMMENVKLMYLHDSVNVLMHIWIHGSSLDGTQFIHYIACVRSVDLTHTHNLLTHHFHAPTTHKALANRITTIHK